MYSHGVLSAPVPITITAAETPSGSRPSGSATPSHGSVELAELVELVELVELSLASVAVVVVLVEPEDVPPPGESLPQAAIASPSTMPSVETRSHHRAIGNMVARRHRGW